MTCLNFRMNLERQAILTENGRASRKAVARIRRDLRSRTVMYARAAGLVKGLQRVRVFMRFHWHAPNRRRDVGNWMPTAKPIVDGLVDYGLVPDDSNKYLEGPFLLAGKESSPELVTWVDVIIENLDEQEAA